MSNDGKFGSETSSTSRRCALKSSITPLAIIEYERKDQRRLCENLERIADQLPDEVDVSLYESIFDKFRINLPIYHRNEEALFHCLDGHAPSLMDISSVLERVRHEHAVHNCYADELNENLEALRAGRGTQNPNAIGYMLRFCFETMRRHLAWEDLTLMPLVGKFLTTEDLMDLSEILAKNRKAISLNIV